jgi:iron-sulfur cluster assembly protein
MATPAPRPKPKVMRISDAAAARLKDIMSEAERPLAGLRVGVEKGGCAGMSYTMEYAEAAGPHDEVIEEKGVRVFIDPKAVLYLLGTEMDYQVDKFTAGFVFNNPNQTAACGCGQSVELAPAKVE